MINKQLYYRLIALWAVTEGVLGGIIHGFNLPVTGLIIGGAAVIIICLIGFYVPVNGAIIRATILVAIFKMMLSPQSPLPAYFAVFFQGLTGELIFYASRKLGTSRLTRLPKATCILFAAIALTESGIQRIIIMTLIYGVAFWKAVNSFINGLTHQQTVTNYSLLLATGYVLLHLVVGVFIGWTASKIPERIQDWSIEFFSPNASEPEQASVNEDILTTGKKRIKINTGLFIIWIVLFAFFLQSELNIGPPLLPPDITLHILIRSVLILLTWYIVLSPMITFFLKKWLLRKQQQSQSTINEILMLIPSTKSLVQRSWNSTSDKQGFQRLNKFLKIVLVNSLREHE